MREPPVDLADATLRACLRARYGLAVTQLAFLPLGHDASAWIYRATTENNGDFFVKVRGRVANEAGLLVPRYLHDRGIARVVAPLPTTTGALWAEVGDYAAILYPFVAGTTGMERGMSARQWIDYGALLWQVHEVILTPELARIVGRDTFAPTGADLIGRLETHIGTRPFDDPAEHALATCWRARRSEIRVLLERAQRLGQQLAATEPEFVLCHADIHTANVLLDDDGQVWFVDWDETIVAPRERDLMFVVGGISSKLVGPDEEAHFFRGYGATDVDPLALAYYRYAWAVADISAFGAEVFFRPDFGPATKGACAELFAGLFQPGEIVALALASRTGMA